MKLADIKSDPLLSRVNILEEDFVVTERRKIDFYEHPYHVQNDTQEFV